MRHVFALALAVALVPSASNAQPTTAAAPAAVSPKALELLEVLSPRAEFEEQFVTNFVASFNHALSSDPRVKAIETAKPGLIKAFEDALLREVKAALPTEYGLFSAGMAGAYQQAFSEQDMQSIIAFFRSPPGVHLLARMKVAGQVSLDQMRNAGQLKKVEDLPDAVETVVTNAAAAGVADLSEDDLKAVTTFGMQPAGRKMAQAQQQLLAMQVQQAQAMATRLSAKIQPAIQKVMAGYATRN
jgi:hypothetical protein